MSEPHAGEIYKHFKGTFYLVVGCSTHTETEERLVNYYALGFPEEVWTRPLTHWNSIPDCRPNEVRFELQDPS